MTVTMAKDDGEDLGGSGPEWVRIVKEEGSDEVVTSSYAWTVGRVALPLGLVCGVMFGVGIAAGVPLGMGAARAEEKDGKRPRVEVTRAQMADGAKWAARAFGYGTLLCAAMGVAGVLTVRRVYEVDSIEGFGQRMREVLPARRRAIEEKAEPVVEAVKRVAGETLPGWFCKQRDAFMGSRFGAWMRRRVEESTAKRAVEKNAAVEERK